MSFIDDIRRKATGLRRQVVLPEGTDPRTIAAAVILQRLELPAPVLLGPVDQIRQAVEKLFKVKVLAVRTMNVTGKKKRMGRFLGRKSDWKKA